MEENTTNESHEPKSSNTGKIIGIAVVAIVVLAIIGFVITAYKPKSSSNAESAATSPSNNETNTVQTATATYKDGTYTADGNYTSPGGDEMINVKLTVKDNTVTDVTVTGNTRNATDTTYQNKFIGGVKQVVVGKKLSGLKLDRVSGSSLTPQGFNDAVSKIQTQAKA